MVQHEILSINLFTLVMISWCNIVLMSWLIIFQVPSTQNWSNLVHESRAVVSSKYKIRKKTSYTVYGWEPLHISNVILWNWRIIVCVKMQRIGKYLTNIVYPIPQNYFVHLNTLKAVIYSMIQNQFSFYTRFILLNFLFVFISFQFFVAGINRPPNLSMIDSEFE